MITCPADHDERQTLMSHVSSLYPRIQEMDGHEAFIILLTNEEVYYKPIGLGELSSYNQRWCGLIRRSLRFLLRQMWQVHEGQCGYLHINIFASILHANMCASTLHVNIFASVLHVYVFFIYHNCTGDHLMLFYPFYNTEFYCICCVLYFEQVFIVGIHTLLYIFML